MYRVFTIYMMPIWFRYEYQHVNYSVLVTRLVLNFVARDKYHMKYRFQWKVTVTHFHEVFEHHFCLEKVADWKRCYQHKMCLLCTYVALSNALSKHSNSNCVKKNLKALKSLHAAFLNNKFQYFHSGIL